MVDDERSGGITNPAEPMVAGEDPFPPAGEAGAVAAAAVVAPLAQPAAVEIRRPAGAAQRELLLMASGGHHGINGFFSSAPRRCPCRSDPGTLLLSKLSFECKKDYDNGSYHRQY